MKLEDFILNSDVNIYVRPDDEQHFNYADGGENYIREILLSATDLSISSPEIKINPRSLIDGWIISMEQENEKLDNQSIEEILNPLIIEYNELINKKRIFDIKPKLAREICRQRKVELLNKCIELCNTRNVTLFSNQLASEFITENLRDNFKKELAIFIFKEA